MLPLAELGFVAAWADPSRTGTAGVVVVQPKRMVPAGPESLEQRPTHAWTQAAGGDPEPTNPPTDSTVVNSISLSIKHE